MPKTKAKKSEEIEETKKIEDSDIEDENDELSSDGESDVEENEVASEDEGEDQDQAKAIVKTDKVVETFESIFKDLTDTRTKIGTSEVDKINLIKDYEQKLKEITSTLKTLRSNEKKLIEKIPKIHKNEVVKASKEKRKRNKENKGGFNKEAPVPEILREFLDLEEGIELSRPAVMSKLNTKFKDLGLKDGQKTILNKETAKLFGLKKGHVIPFEGMQTFLKEQYTKSNSTSV